MTNVLKAFASAETVANSYIQTTRKCFKFEYEERRKQITLSAEQLKATSKVSVAEEIQIRHLVCQIEMIEEQLSEINKKIEEFSLQNNSLSSHTKNFTLLGYLHFSGIRRYLQLYKIISDHSDYQICRCHFVSL